MSGLTWPRKEPCFCRWGSSGTKFSSFKLQICRVPRYTSSHESVEPGENNIPLCKKLSRGVWRFVSSALEDRSRAQERMQPGGLPVCCAKAHTALLPLPLSLFTSPFPFYPFPGARGRPAVSSPSGGSPRHLVEAREDPSGTHGLGLPPSFWSGNTSLSTSRTPPRGSSGVASPQFL